MATVTLAADSTTLVLNGHVFTDFVAGDKLELAYVNPQTSRTNSANGGTNIQGRTDAGVATLTIRVQRFGDDDVFLNSQINQAQPVVYSGSMKEEFNRDGQDFVESFVLESGSHTTKPTHTKNDQDGNNLSEYVLEFRNAQRNL